MRIIIAPLVILVALFLYPSVQAQQRKEADYADIWCAERSGTRFVLPDRTRVDCLTKTHAVEVDYARKWFEAVGQSLHYARMTKRRAGILLLIRRGNKPDERKVEALRKLIEHYRLAINLFLLNIR